MNLPLLFLALFSLSTISFSQNLAQAGGVMTQICMVVDGSDSITSKEWNIIKYAIAKAINETVPRDGSVEITIVQFGYPPAKNYTKIEVPPTVIDGTNYAQVSSLVMNMPKGDGSTPIAHGLFLGWKELMNSPRFAASKQIINLATDELPNVRNMNATSDLDGDKNINARDDVIAVVKIATDQGLDELDIEGISIPASYSNWFKSWVVHPQPGISAPPFSKPGWIRVVANVDEFAGTMTKKFMEIMSEEEAIWVPSVEGALAAGLLMVGAASALSALGTAVSNPENYPGNGMVEKINSVFPDVVKQWLQDFISSKRKLVIAPHVGSLFTVTRAEALSFVASFSILTLAFAYSKAESIGQILALVPVILVTSVVVEFAKAFAMEVVARIQGVWAEYRLWYFGLSTFLLSTLLFKAPFSSPSRICHHAPRFTSRSQGLVALTGVSVAMAFAGAFYLLIANGFPEIGNVGLVMALTMALFDSIPIPPMNGKDVYDWSRALWLALFTGTFSLYLLCLLLF